MNRPLGASPAAIEAFKAVAGHLETYPEGSARLLREAIGEVHGLNPDRIVCGNGSDELLTMLAGCYLRPGDEVLFSQHAFIVYRIAALANSAVPVSVPEKNLRTDVDAMLAAVSPKTRMVLSRQSQQSHRLLSDRRGGAPPACGPAIHDAAGDRCGLCRICPAQRLQIRHRDGLAIRERRDDAHLLQDLRPCRIARRLGFLPGACRRCAAPRARPVQCLGPGADGGRRRHARPRAMSKPPWPSTSIGANG